MRFSYVIRRVIMLFIVVWAAVTVNFFVPRLSGQDPIRARLARMAAAGGYVQAGWEDMVELYDKKFGLDKPLWRQYLTYLADMARLDFGPSYSAFPTEVIDVILQSLPWTIALLSVTTVLTFVAGTLFGALLGQSRSPLLLRWLAPPILTLSAIPYYLLGLILLFAFAFGARWFPSHGGFTAGATRTWTWSFVKDVLRHSVLPAASIILSAVGFWALGMRGMMVTVAGEDYMVLAEAKGLKRASLFLRYGLRNAILPQITSLALALGYVVSGSVLVEVVFSYPGVGLTLYNAVRQFDFPLIQGIVFTIVVALAVSTLILDLSLPLLDPRIGRRS